jgi:hypothetical protein
MSIQLHCARSIMPSSFIRSLATAPSFYALANSFIWKQTKEMFQYLC